MKKEIAIIGFGARGRIYKAFADKNPDLFNVVAAVDVDQEKREQLQKGGVKYVYEDYKDFLKDNHKLDMVIISTSDALHREQAVACLEKGYHLLLEKPIATTLEDCEAILDVANKNNRKVFVAHVLRYTPFYRTLKEIVDSGKLGEVFSIHASENIGFYHFANSYVRGNWHREADSSPVILAKCCHDMDIIAYLMNEQCVSVSSVGELSHFNEKCAPEGSTEYCSDCPIGGNCVYNAQRVYTTYGRSFGGYFFNKEGTDSELLAALKGSDYDKCVYHNDNDVVDHQSTVMLFENGKTAVHTMVAFSKEIYRDIKIYGTKAELVGVMEENFIEIRTFGGDVERVPVIIPDDVVGGHCGGDNYFMQQIYYALNDEPCKGITYLDVSVQSHRMAFAAEKSRKNQGEMLKIN